MNTTETATLSPTPSHNPAGTDGFEFVEFASENPQELATLFESLGFTATARHRSKQVTLYQQGDINFILNAEPEGFSADFVKKHGPSACAMGFRVQDAAQAFERSVANGAKPYTDAQIGYMELNLPTLYGIGGSLLYLIDRYGEEGTNIYDIDFIPIEGADKNQNAVGLETLDHLTHNLHRGQMSVWAQYYEDLFNFREIRFFNIEGKQTGLFSKALTSPCGKIRIPLNESADENSQIEEFLEKYNGEGIQHIALSTSDIYQTIETLRAQGMEFMFTPDTYYEKVDTRVPNHGEDLARLQKNKILVDGNPDNHEGLLLQIFTNTVIGPIFFEIIQRKGNEGFGEGNFQALFESIEEDQIRRGVI